MSVSQVSVFLESRPGHMKRILDDFVSAGLSVRGFSLSDTGDYGIARFIVDNAPKALDVLSASGAAAVCTPLLCVKLEDTPGELARVVSEISDRGINVEYSYSLISTYVAMKVADVAAAEQLLADGPVEIVSDEQLVNLA